MKDSNQRLLLTVVMCMAVALVWSLLFQPKSQPQQHTTPSPAATQPATPAPTTSSASTPGAAAPAPAAARPRE